MICEVCRERDADIVFKTVTGNQVATKAMCMSCAHNMQQDMIKMFMALGFHKDQIEQRAEEPAQAPTMPSRLCAACGRPYHGLDDQTMAGCAACYEAMRQDLKAEFKRGEATGDENKPEMKDEAPAEKADDLRYRLMEAVIREDFEEAAALRDRIAGRGQVEDLG